MSLLLSARTDLIIHARPSHRYCKQAGIDWTATEPATGGLYLAPIAIEGRRFQIAPKGREAAVIEAIGADGETVVDLVAWPVDEPSRVLTAIGAAHVLGEAVASNPSTYFMGRPLQLFRHPLAWMQAGCNGTALLNMPRAGRWLIDVPGKFAPEDKRHAEEIHKAMLAAAGLDRIVLPSRSRMPA